MGNGIHGGMSPHALSWWSHEDRLDGKEMIVQIGISSLCRKTHMLARPKYSLYTIREVDALCRQRQPEKTRSA